MAIVRLEAGGADIRPFGLILAGGRSQRMGGGDKTLRLLGGHPIIAWIIEALAPQCRALAISARGDPARWQAFGLPVLPDPVADPVGPLAGVLAGLIHLERTGASDWLLTVPGDTPFLPPDLVARLAAARTHAGSLVARAESDGRAHPVVALWSVALRPTVEEALIGRGRRGVAAFQAGVSTATAHWDTLPHDPFFNLNTPDEMVAAERGLTDDGLLPGPAVPPPA